MQLSQVLLNRPGGGDSWRDAMKGVGAVRAVGLAESCSYWFWVGFGLRVAVRGMWLLREVWRSWGVRVVGYVVIAVCS